MTIAGKERLEGFAQDLHQEILLRSGSDGNLREESFTEHVLGLLNEHNEADTTEFCSFESRGRGAVKLSAWSLSGDGATLDLFVTLYHGTGKVLEVGKPDTRKHFGLLWGFLRQAMDGAHTKLEESSGGFQAMFQIHEARESLTTVRLFFLTDGVVRVLDVGKDRLPNIEVKHVVWDLDKLSRLRVGDRQSITLDFVNDYGGAIPCLKIEDDTGEYKTFLAFLKAPLLARIYGEHGQRLLERNVRAFLQAKGKINRGLQKTLKEEPHRFLAYNNGLCCTAADVDVQVDKSGHAQLRLVRDFQIVNGGQTTASIYHAVKKDKTDITNVIVQMKLTVLSDAKRVEEIVPLISRYANSQNKVNTADFSANGPFHLHVEQFSRAVWAPAKSGIDRQTHWYYERARGSYADDKTRQPTKTLRSDWEKQNPRDQKFTKTDLAKFELTWEGAPNLVCHGAEKAFLRHAERMDDEKDVVVDQVYFRHIIAKAILFRTTEKLFSSSTPKLEGYRAQSVAYAVAWMAERSGKRINLDLIWEQQRLSKKLCDALKIACRHAHAHITGQEGNPGEAAKKEACWIEFRNKQLPVGDDWMKELADTPFVPARSDEESLARQWEDIRQQFLKDKRSIGEIEALAGKNWIQARRKDKVADYAGCNWEEIRGANGLGAKRLRGLIEMLAAAAGD